MRRTLLFFSVLFSFSSLFAQNNPQNIRPSSLGFSFVFYDFVTPQRIKSSSLSTVLREKQTAAFKDMGTGLSVSYFKGLREKLDLAATFTFVSAGYSLPSSLRAERNELVLQADAAAQFKMVPDSYLFSPYVTAGVGANKYGGYFGTFMPLGVGFKFNFFEEASLFVNAKYHLPITDETVRGHLVYGFGLAGAIGSKKEAALLPVPVP